MANKQDVQQGTLALMILKTLETLGPQHGYGIARRIEQTSGNLLLVNYGTLYPALLKQALSDLRPGVPGSPKERTLVRQARAAIRSVIEHAQRMQERLARLPRVTLATAYRNKKELSERDKKLLDDLAEDLLKRNNRSRPKDGR